MSTAREHRALYESAGEKRKVAASLAGSRLTASVEGGAAKMWDARLGAPGEVVLRDDAGRVVRAFVAMGGAPGEVLVSIDGRVRKLAPVDERRARAGHGQHDAALEAPMPGTCRDVFVKAGDLVEKGARLVLIEAMKMEHELKAPRGGKVKAVAVKKGEAVAPGSALVELE